MKNLPTKLTEPDFISLLKASVESYPDRSSQIIGFNRLLSWISCGRLVAYGYEKGDFGNIFPVDRSSARGAQSSKEHPLKLSLGKAVYENGQEYSKTSAGNFSFERFFCRRSDLESILSPHKQQDFNYSDDFSSISFKGAKYAIDNRNMRMALICLNNARLKGRKSLRECEILKEIGRSDQGMKMRDFFRCKVGRELWGKLVIRLDQGKYGLSVSPPTSLLN